VVGGGTGSTEDGAKPWGAAGAWDGLRLVARDARATFAEQRMWSRLVFLPNHNLYVLKLCKCIISCLLVSASRSG
jgi:hypothetical protein